MYTTNWKLNQNASSMQINHKNFKEEEKHIWKKEKYVGMFLWKFKRKPKPKPFPT